ncbi:MAG: hypothetical protein K2Q13_11265 [Nitrosomonas sp.]|uniref:hypothetical protein n=1 Tax=Nitrosomonas sp. TaxID=42353 RepID=UPI0025D95FD9|nr:hypothetical protein [Nitrosomonas sp.]MBY0475622.1 hypothetical protein [Nitrosomonas sp.]
MLIKLFLAVSLSLSVASCFAESDGNKSKSLIDPSQQKRLSTDSSQQKQAAQPNASTKSTDSQSPQNSNQENKPSMIDFCRKNPC